MKKNLLLSFLLLLYFCGIAQMKKDSAVRHELSFIIGVQFNNNINGGLFYNKISNIDNEPQNYKQILSGVLPSFSLGVKYKNIFQNLDLSYIKATKTLYCPDFTNGKLDLGGDNITVKYLGYEAWYDFLHKKKFPLKPLLAINLIYVDKQYKINSSPQLFDGATFSLNDNSKAFLIQMPVGLYLDYGHFIISLSYNLPVFAWIKGSLEGSLIQGVFIDSVGWVNWETTKIVGNYSGNSLNRNFEKQRDIFSLKVLFAFK